METTYRVAVAFESLRVGDIFTSEPTIRLRMLVVAGYLVPLGGEEVEPTAEGEPKRTRRRVKA